jgi:hypothetical protein
MGTVTVNVDNFTRAETERMFGAIMADAGSLNRSMHNRVPTPLDHQPVIRQNRDTLYSRGVHDISQGATLTIPDAGGRYLAVMPINQDGYVNDVLYEPGEHRLTVEKYGTDYVMLPVRILVDPSNPKDVTAANALQDQVVIRANASRPFAVTDWDPDTFTATRNALLDLAKGLPDMRHAFGAREQVDPVRFLIASAAAWGGLPDDAAQYLNVHPGLPVGAYELTVKDVPVDGFWSVSLYNADGYFPTDTGGRVSVNNLTAERNPDGSVTIHFGGPDGQPNLLPIMDGWNYLIRLYRPRPEILDGSWIFPAVQPAARPGKG